MAESSLSAILLGLGRSVISFDPPGAFRSSRPPEITMDEMLGCATETLDRLGIEGAVDLVGHSMGSFCALALALDHPESCTRESRTLS